MPSRTRNRLTAAQVRKTRRAGLHADGGGLFLQVTTGKDGTPRRSWVVRVRIDGKTREMGLGSVHEVELAKARILAEAARRLARDGVDPIEQRLKDKREREAVRAKAVTFKEAATRYITGRGETWKNEKHRAQWSSTLETYVYPVFGTVAVGDVNVGMILKVLEPIWLTKTETASRIRSRIERVLDWARTHGHRSDDNPARWRGHLENVLAPLSAAKKVRHHPALPYAEIADFMTLLKTRNGMSARALELTILTAARTGETTQAKWSEIDLAKKVWTVPAARMKAKREHRVPLSPAAIKVLETVKLDRDGDDWVFPGLKKDAPLSSMAMLQLLDSMGRGDLTTHGFRSTFRDWTAEQTDFPGDAAEAALAHVVGDKVEAAYRRGDLFDKRRALMEAWAAYCDPSSVIANERVVALRPKRQKP